MEKQQAIINAGYRAFSQNSYKNSPMSEIADSAGISKFLLFYYFRNKKELYLFLWDKCAEMEKGFTRLIEFWKSVYLRKEWKFGSELPNLPLLTQKVRQEREKYGSNQN
ncbi:MAG: TetR/AcrR family transcriptional regulator [Muricoprocola sp.]